MLSLIALFRTNRNHIMKILTFIKKERNLPFLSLSLVTMEEEEFKVPRCSMREAKKHDDSQS